MAQKAVCSSTELLYGKIPQSDADHFKKAAKTPSRILSEKFVKFFTRFISQTRLGNCSLLSSLRVLAFVLYNALMEERVAVFSGDL